MFGVPAFGDIIHVLEKKKQQLTEYDHIIAQNKVSFS